MTREQAERLTREYTETMRSRAYGTPGPLYASGNTQEGETGYCFDVEHEGSTFMIEVFGPTYDRDA